MAAFVTHLDKNFIPNRYDVIHILHSILGKLAYMHLNCMNVHVTLLTGVVEVEGNYLRGIIRMKSN